MITISLISYAIASLNIYILPRYNLFVYLCVDVSLKEQLFTFSSCCTIQCIKS